ncbi:MAG: response regulator transcription factor [Rubrivivax sp.]|nr:MAG: response regulator transcription factor [Rubrivivax sp.]
MSAHPIRVVLADDHGVVRLGLRALLNSAPGIQVVGEASDGHEALSLVEALKPDIVIMDVSMAGMDGVAATRELARRQVSTRVLALTMHEEEAYLVPLLEAGAMGYVVKSAASSMLLLAIQAVSQGRRFVRPEAAGVLADALVRRVATGEIHQRHASLSERERAVFLLIARGYTSSQIGEQLFISAKTADTYRRRINSKLGINERADYVRLALDLDLLTETRCASPPALQ